MNRIAVRYQGIALMPMKTKRVQKYLDSGKAKIRYDKKLKIHYLQLLVEPSGFNTQEIKKDQEQKKFYTINLVNVEGKMFHYVKFRKDVEYEMSFVMKLDSGELLGEEPKAFGGDGIVRNDPGLFEMVRKECIDIMKDYHYQLGEKLKRL